MCVLMDPYKTPLVQSQPSKAKPETMNLVADFVLSPSAKYPLLATHEQGNENFAGNMIFVLKIVTKIKLLQLLIHPKNKIPRIIAS
jgi:hypothetical protein